MRKLLCDVLGVFFRLLCMLSVLLVSVNRFLFWVKFVGLVWCCMIC